MKNITLALLGLTILFASCKTTLSTMSKNSAPFPGMTVTRADYKLSKDEVGTVEVKEWTTLFHLVHAVKTVGEKKKEKHIGLVSGYGLDKASEIAAYRLLEAHPDFDYLTNIRITKQYTKSWKFLFTTYKTEVKIVAKGITLNTEK